MIHSLDNAARTWPSLMLSFAMCSSSLRMPSSHRNGGTRIPFTGTQCVARAYDARHIPTLGTCGRVSTGGSALWRLIGMLPSRSLSFGIRCDGTFVIGTEYCVMMGAESKTSTASVTTQVQFTVQEVPSTRPVQSGGWGGLEYDQREKIDRFVERRLRDGHEDPS